MDADAISADGFEVGEARAVKPTEKGQEYYKKQRDSLFSKVNSTGKILSECLRSCEPLPKSLTALENAESTLLGAFNRYNSCANDYMDFLSHSRYPESDQELTNYWPTMNNLKKQFNDIMDKIQTKKESTENSSQTPSTSTRSCASLAANKRTKAESEKVKLQFVQKETEIKKEQFEKTLLLELLEQQKAVAAADAEATYLEQQLQEDSEERKVSAIPPKDEITPLDKTSRYIESLNSPVAQQSLFAQATPFVPNAMPKVTETSTPGIYRQNPLIEHTAQGPVTQGYTSSFQSYTPMLDTSKFLIKKNILLESFQQQQFDDRPDRYVVWKTQFRTVVTDIKCSALEEISLLTNCIHKDSFAYRLVMSARTSCASNPVQCLHTIWKRMDERFGSAELLESTLKARLLDLPDSIDRKKLYGLHDLLTEIEAVKNLDEYSAIFSCLDSSLGIKPVVQKLARQLQEKWVTRAINYKSQHAVLFPPFAEFVKFIGEMSVIRNDPGLIYEMPKETKGVQKTGNKNRTELVSSRKTNISSGTDNSRTTLLPCLIHKGSKHTINECRAFQYKPLDERKTLLRNHNICLRCCETSDHFAKKCQSNIRCDSCQSNSHCTALHPSNDTQKSNEQSSMSTAPVQKYGEESSVSNRLNVNSNCTEICGKPSFSGRSCARIVPVRIYPDGQPENSVTAYAMLDDQSNKTLGRSHLLDSLDIKSSPIEYSMQSCSGKTVSFGRIASGLIVEGFGDNHNVKLKLPPVLECDNLPDNHMEIPTPEVARYYPHMKEIAKHLKVMDPSVKIQLLIGRDLPEAHHTIDQRIGPLKTPFAQRSLLGWTIIGDVCLSGQHIPSTLASSKTFVNEYGRPTTLEPCYQTVNIRDNVVNTCKTQVTKINIFETSSDDNKPGLSIEDRKFIDIMDKEFHLNSEGRWTAPLPFRSPREPLPDNYQMALRRAKSLDASLHNNEVKKSHFLAFMQKILDNEHAELAPYIPAGKERWYLPLFGVYHPRKPDQIRGVFDASAKYEGVCLNDQLLQGPDLINDLLGILIRFRKDKIAVVADVQQMFHSFLVEEEHRDYLRFLWHKDNIIENPLVTYRMRVHVFGNRPSPSIAMYGLQRIGKLSEKTHGPEVKKFIVNDFYVDDGLKSCPTEQDAIDLLYKTQDAMKIHGNLRLHKFASNSKTVMNAFDTQDLAKDLVELDFEKDVPTQRSLGLLWDLKSDIFKFSISNENKPVTRKGILSTVNSLYDPLGFLSPVTISGKINLRKIIQRHRNAKSASFSKINDADLFLDTERIVIKNVQGRVYQEEISCLKSSKPLSKSSPIFTLDPYIDTDGLLRVGGRLKRLQTDVMFKNPIILPAKHHITTLIARKCHQDVKHQGRHITEGRIRLSGYWIVGGKRLVTSIIFNCVTCRRLRKCLDHQKMSDLPEERVLPGYPPFSFVRVDVFGPWEIITRKTRGGSANNKRWAALFTCLATRAVHVEVLEDMSASAFINSLRRFIAIRGCVRIIRSDRGTNVVGAVNELKLNSINVEDGPVHDYLTKQGTTWIFNPPHASHMGEVWERMIGTTRRILDSMLLEYGASSLTHDVLTTFLAEACSIINSRPLVPTSTDPDNPFILTPSTLLTQKTNMFDATQINSSTDHKDLLRKQWKRVQHLASVFWKRWKVEYLNTLQNRRKWNLPQRNVTTGDVVLIRDKELCRNSWPLGLVMEAVQSEDGLVRKVLVRVIIDGIPKTYVRPVNELVVLVPC